MENHYHLIVDTSRAILSSFMHSLSNAYTTYFNIKRKRISYGNGKIFGIFLCENSCEKNCTKWAKTC
jgi:hypothetical protein